MRAYIDGPETLRDRRRSVRDYLNSVPLAAQRGHGEVIGASEGETYTLTPNPYPLHWPFFSILLEEGDGVARTNHATLDNHGTVLDLVHAEDGTLRWI